MAHIFQISGKVQYSNVIKIIDLFQPPDFDTRKLSEEKVKITICLCRANETSGPHKGWNIKSFELSDQEIRRTEKNSSNTAQNTFSSRFSVLVDTLERSRIEPKKLKEHIEISDINFSNMETTYMQKVLEWLNQFDVIHILPGSFSKEAEESIYNALHLLKKRCIIISPCVATRRPPAPVDFPGHMVISVGYDKKQPKPETNTGEEIPLMTEMELYWQSCGSALDFLCKGWTVLPALEIKDPWEASYYATGIAALVLVKAHALGK